MSAQGVKGIEASLPEGHSLLFFGLEPYSDAHDAIDP